MIQSEEKVDMDSWTLVFTRTFQVDYRFLGVPKGFGEASLNEARRFIDGALSGTDFGERIRWSAFRVNGSFILGCSGTVASILGSDELAFDRHQRKIYAFVAVALERDHPTSIPSPDELLPKLRGILDRELRDAWMFPGGTTPRQPKVEIPDGNSIQPFEVVEPAGVMIRPDEDSQNWRLIHEVAANSHRSVCIGMKEVSDLYDGEGRLYPFTDFVMQGQCHEYPLSSPEAPPQPPTLRRPANSVRIAPPPASPPTSSEPIHTPRPSWIPLVAGAGFIGVLVWAATKSAFLLVCSAVVAGTGVYALGRLLTGKASPTFASREEDEPATVAPPPPLSRKERRSPWV
jgi:hypothetical protein